jgi:hypothetical protein
MIALLEAPRRLCDMHTSSAMQADGLTIATT